MAKRRKELQTQHNYSEEFKKSLVKDYDSKKLTITELSRIHNVSKASIYTWLYKYSNYLKKKIRIVELESSTTQKIKDYERQIRDLQQILGQKQMLIDYYVALIEKASDDYNIDLKKNTNTKR